MQYLKRLKVHPGVPVAIDITLMLILVGVANDMLSSFSGVTIGLICATPIWCIVLWTARMQPPS